MVRMNPDLKIKMIAKQTAEAEAIPQIPLPLPFRITENRCNTQQQSFRNQNTARRQIKSEAMAKRPVVRIQNIIDAMAISNGGGQTITQGHNSTVPSLNISSNKVRAKSVVKNPKESLKVPFMFKRNGQRHTTPMNNLNLDLGKVTRLRCFDASNIGQAPRSKNSFRAQISSRGTNRYKASPRAIFTPPFSPNNVAIIRPTSQNSAEN